MLGNNITMLEAGMVTIFSMSVVFVTLLVISFMIDGIKLIFSREKAINKSKAPTKQAIVQIEKKEDEEEIVAVITAALAAQLGKKVDQLIVRSIIQVRNQEPVWAQAGRMELMK